MGSSLGNLHICLFSLLVICFRGLIFPINLWHQWWCYGYSAAFFVVNILQFESSLSFRILFLHFILDLLCFLIGLVYLWKHTFCMVFLFLSDNFFTLWYFPVEHIAYMMEILSDDLLELFLNFKLCICRLLIIRTKDTDFRLIYGALGALCWRC